MGSACKSWTHLLLLLHKIILKCIFTNIGSLLCIFLDFSFACFYKYVCIIYSTISLFIDDFCFVLLPFVTTSNVAINIHLYYINLKNLFLPGFQIWVMDSESWPLYKSVMILFPYIKN